LNAPASDVNSLEILVPKHEMTSGKYKFASFLGWGGFSAVVLRGMKKGEKELSKIIQKGRHEKR
jgi:hypothetical protein